MVFEFDSFLSFLPPRFRHNRHPDCRYGRFDGRDFKHGHRRFVQVVFAVRMAPSISRLCFGVAFQVKNFNVAFPYRLAPENLMNGHGGAMDGPAVVQMLRPA